MGWARIWRSPTTRPWETGRIGVAMAAMGVGTVTARTPAGAWIDATRHKRLATATGLGAAFSNLATGYIVQAGGHDAGFYALSAVAVAAFGFYALLVPETRRDREEPTEPLSPRLGETTPILQTTR